MDKVPIMSDHDVLVTLNTKFDLLAIDVKDIKDNIVARIAKVETRLDSMDLYHASIPLKDYEALAKWVENFRSNLKFLFTVAGLSLAIVGGLVSQILVKWLKIS